ncbi:MAG: hypothetical protein HYZ14_15280 [Bacteroidetes bacterium]|nr:hypothetical protein [Bacteroidota bacterium]
MQKGWDYVDETTQKGKSDAQYRAYDFVRRTIDLYFEKFFDFLRKRGQKEATISGVYTDQESGEDYIIFDSDETTAPGPLSGLGASPQQVELISLELKFIKKFLGLHGKKKIRHQIRLFLNMLQRSMKEMRIRKTSKYADQILQIQDELIKLHSRFVSDKQKITVDHPEAILEEYSSILGKQVEYLSIKFIKSYIGLQGKLIETKKVENLFKRIINAIQSEKINKSDKYWKEIESILRNLKDFVNKNPKRGILRIAKLELNGLHGILGYTYEAESLSGTGRVPENTIMNSLDAVQLKFEKLGLTGKWLDFIGNPSRNFTMMIYGLPKMGKSILAVDFAGHLARNHGRVLYVAKEEGIDDTLIEKLDAVAHEQLDVSNYLPDDISGYNFIFLDSVTKLGLTPTELNLLQEQYSDKAFIYIFQTTKDGKFRGSNQFQHDVDVVVNVYEKGKASQYGRFNQGGELDIF